MLDHLLVTEYSFYRPWTALVYLFIAVRVFS